MFGFISRKERELLAQIEKERIEKEEKEKERIDLEHKRMCAEEIWKMMSHFANTEGKSNFFFFADQGFRSRPFIKSWLGRSFSVDFMKTRSEYADILNPICEVLCRKFNEYQDNKLKAIGNSVPIEDPKANHVTEQELTKYAKARNKQNSEINKKMVRCETALDGLKEEHDKALARAKESNKQKAKAKKKNEKTSKRI